MMDSWFPPPLTAFEMEARRAAAEEGRFPPSDPAIVPIQYPQNVDYNFPRVLSRSCSHSSSGTPPPYTEDRHTIIPSPVRVDSEVLNHSHPNCSNQYLPITVYNEEYLNYQPEWKGTHQTQPLAHSKNYSVVYTNPNHEDLQLKKRTSNALQTSPTVDNGFHQGYSPSSSPLSAYDQVSIGGINSKPTDYPASCTFISQVFKPLYNSQEHKRLGPHSSYLPVRDGKCSEAISLNPLLKVDSSKESSESYQRMIIPGGRKGKRSNEKRFACPDCGRMFARAFNMETHRKTHIGYRPHHCPQCQKSFSRRHDLHRHLAAVHNEQSKSLQQNSMQTSSPQGCFKPGLDRNEKNVT